MRIRADELSETISRELGLYSNDVMAGIKKETQSSMRKLVKETKAQHYKAGNGDYKKAISSKKVTDTPNDFAQVWYVKDPHYRRTHLLEHGHAKANGGRTVAYGTIGKAMAQIEPDYLKRIEAIIRGD